ncbi:hypothetical protein PRK78_001403 [Emydomyces testavorans]|uniref:Putative gamma-glutamylcyclotransferase n=1 Tax=Emydomyces testavorans TaxID=2070801 RepID=A0AAF0DCV0_9EURO|nr:hypothetical protein PRK78_001403 [Emydomyces testavorans]
MSKTQTEIPAKIHNYNGEKGNHRVSTSAMDTTDVSTFSPIFVYGTLMAEELLSWVLTGSSENHELICSLRQPAVLTNFRRVPVKHGDYPALIPGGPSDQVDGYLISPRSASEWKKLDDFEGELYQRCQVNVLLVSDNLDGGNKCVSANVYVWAGSMDDIWQDREWDISHFRQNRLEDWLDLFDGMEMVG